MTVSVEASDIFSNRTSCCSVTYARGQCEKLRTDRVGEEKEAGAGEGTLEDAPLCTQVVTTAAIIHVAMSRDTCYALKICLRRVSIYERLANFTYRS